MIEVTAGSNGVRLRRWLHLLPHPGHPQQRLFQPQVICVSPNS
jgi:hypothetical protein